MMKKRLFIAFVVMVVLAAIGSLALAQGTGSFVSGSGTVTGTWGVWEVSGNWDQYSYRATDLLVKNNSCLGTAAQGAGYQFSGQATVYNFSSYADWWDTPYFELGFGRGVNGMDQNLDGVIDWASESYTPALYVIALGNGSGGYDVHLQELSGQRPASGAIYSTASGVGQPFTFTFNVVIQGGQATLTVNGVQLDSITLTSSQDYDAFNVNIADWRGGYWQNRETGEIWGSPYGDPPAAPGSAEYSVSGAPISAIVDVDIKPGSDPNSINLSSKGMVPVAVLTADCFDASTVDPDTVLFTGARPVRWAVEDVDSDGDMDMLFHFKTRELNLDGNSTEATLTGETRYGTQIEGTDTVNIVSKGK